MENKVQINLSNFNTHYDIKVQDTVGYEVLETYEDLTKEEAMKIVESLCRKYPNYEKCEFLY